MNCSKDVERMCAVTKGPNHGPAPIPEEGRWVKAYDVKDISALSHGVGTCAPQQGACKLTLNVKNGIWRMSFKGHRLPVQETRFGKRDIRLRRIPTVQRERAFSRGTLPRKRGQERLLRTF